MWPKRSIDEPVVFVLAIESSMYSLRASPLLVTCTLPRCSAQKPGGYPKQHVFQIYDQPCGLEWSWAKPRENHGCCVTLSGSVSLSVPARGDSNISQFAIRAVHTAGRQVKTGENQKTDKLETVWTHVAFKVNVATKNWALPGQGLCALDGTVQLSGSIINPSKLRFSSWLASTALAQPLRSITGIIVPKKLPVILHLEVLLRSLECLEMFFSGSWDMGSKVKLPGNQSLDRHWSLKNSTS